MKVADHLILINFEGGSCKTSWAWKRHTQSDSEANTGEWVFWVSAAAVAFHMERGLPAQHCFGSQVQTNQPIKQS